MRFVSKHKECSVSSRAQTLGARHFPRHSLASHAATHVHTCNPAAVENTVASTVVHKLLPHCEHVIHYTVIFFKKKKQDNNRKIFQQLSRRQEKHTIVRRHWLCSALMCWSPASQACIHASAERCYSVSAWNNMPRKSLLHTVKMIVILAGSSCLTQRTFVHPCHRVSQQPVLARTSVKLAQKLILFEN